MAEINRFGYANVTFEDLLVKVNVIKIKHLWAELCPNGVDPPEIVGVTRTNQFTLPRSPVRVEYKSKSHQIVFYPLSWTFETKNSPKLLRKEFVKSLTFSLGHALLIKGLSDDVKTRVHNVISQYPFLAVQLPTMAVGQLIIVGGSRFVMRIPRIGSILYAFGLPVVLPVVTNKVAEKIEGLRDQICEDMTTALLGTHKDRIWDMVEVGQGFTKVEEQR